jgi:tetratricopeptide (TPR) repeat protein
MKTNPFNFLSTVFRRCFILLRITQDEDMFEKEASEGLNMLQCTGFSIFRIKFRMRFFIFKAVWAALSLPLKAFALSGCIAAASGTVYLSRTLFSQPSEKKEVVSEQNIPKDELKQQIFDESDENLEIEETTLFDAYNYNNVRKVGNAEKMLQLESKQTYILPITKTELQSIRFSSLPELFFENLKFVDFSVTGLHKKPLLVPVFSGLEAKFEKREDIIKYEPYMMADTLSYKTFLALTAHNIDKRNYNEADRLINILINQRPFDENGIFYKGYIHFCRGQFSDAINWFNKCEQTAFKSFYTEANYYKALSLYLSGQTEDSMQLIDYLLLSSPVNKEELIQLKETIINISEP